MFLFVHKNQGGDRRLQSLRPLLMIVHPQQLRLVQVYLVGFQQELACLQEVFNQLAGH